MPPRIQTVLPVAFSLQNFIPVIRCVEKFQKREFKILLKVFGTFGIVKLDQFLIIPVL